jgi:hypothetical protein
MTGRRSTKISGWKRMYEGSGSEVTEVNTTIGD